MKTIRKSSTENGSFKIKIYPVKIPSSKRSFHLHEKNEKKLKWQTKEKYVELEKYCNTAPLHLLPAFITHTPIARPTLRHSCPTLPLFRKTSTSQLPVLLPTHPKSSPNPTPPNHPYINYPFSHSIYPPLPP
jgi:hypothetical protein